MKSISKCFSFFLAAIAAAFLVACDNTSTSKGDSTVSEALQSAVSDGYKIPAGTRGLVVKFKGPEVARANAQALADELGKVYKNVSFERSETRPPVVRYYFDDSYESRFVRFDLSKLADVQRLNLNNSLITLWNPVDGWQSDLE